jgi:tetratricopeptide (TPR) repeat protein
MTVLRTTIPLALLVALVLPRAGAQAECRIDEGRPGEVKDARNAIVTRELTGSPEDKKKNFVRAVSLLTRPAERFKANMIGRNFFLGRALVNLAILPEMTSTARAGDIGFTENPDATIDLLALADSLFDAVEAEQPACKAETTQEQRRKPYAELVNQAVNHYNNRDLDSAEVKATRALMIYPDYPLSYIAYNVLGNLQQTKDDNAGAIRSFRRMAELMAGDTATVDERKNTMILAAQLMTNQGELQEGAARKAAMDSVVAYLDGFLQEFPGDIRAQSAKARAQLLSGDAESARRLFDEMLQNPERYTDMNLFEAGVGAARAEQNEAAVALFEAGLKKNAYSRDGLFNLAATYDVIASDSTQPAPKRDSTLEKMPPILERLTAVDPENPDNYRLWARYWQSRARALRPASVGKPETDPAVVAFANANQELLNAFNRMQEAVVKVSFNLFSHDGGRHVLAGTVDNLSEQEKSYTLKFEFLDGAGTVLDTREVPVEGVGGKTSKSFRVELMDKPGVAAFRYAPLPK